MNNSVDSKVIRAKASDKNFFIFADLDHVRLPIRVLGFAAGELKENVICQLCAIVPGLSRSGSTITGGRLCGFSREFAVKFSFILSIPAIIGANIFNIPDVIRDPVPSSHIPAYALGMLVAAVTGIIAMKLLHYISKKSNFKIFSVYCIAIGILTIIFG